MDAAHAAPPATLAEPAFVRWFVVWVPLAALALAAAVWLAPSLWPYVMLADLWLLSFPHVASTFSRTAFREQDRRAFRWTLVALPLVSLAICAGVARGLGLATLNAGYFFWQSFHYVRQGRGMYRALRHAHGRPPSDPLADGAMYSAALWGLTHRLVQHPRTFLGVELALPRIDPRIEWACALLAALTFVAYVLRELRAIAAERERYPAAPLLYVLTQVLLFFVSYVLIESATIGWIAVNVWHNAQYLLFVHAWNQRRFFGATRAEMGPLARLVAPGRGWHFYLAFALIGAVAYRGAGALSDLAAPWWSAAAIYLVIAQAINLQHYIADMVLWRAPAQARS